jgi:hypothetical protein
MANYYNLKYIINDFRTLTAKHKQLNSFGVGDLRNLIFLTQQKEGMDNVEHNAPLYPLLYVIPQQAQRSDSEIIYNFNVIVCDIDNVKNNQIEVDLWSDTLEIAEDVLAQFRYSVDAEQGNFASKYDIGLPTTITPFNEQYEDLLFGWNLQLQVIVDKPLNRCIAPFKDFN